jgi:hypothetical protein
LGILYAKRGTSDPAKLQQRARALGERHGLRIDYGDPAAFFVEPYGVADAAVPGGVMTAADLRALTPALNGIEESLAAYPPGFVSTICKAIFICGSLTLDGAEAGGTFGPSWLILAASLRVGEGGIYETCRLGVHHELSSLIWAKLADVRVSWSTLMPSGWLPARTNAEVLSHRGEQEDRHDGFLNSYGSTTIENDFNTYAETIFAFPSRLTAAARSSPVVLRKVGLVFAAYERMDLRFRETFASLGLDGLRGDGSFHGDVEVNVSPLDFPAGKIVRPGDGE